MSLTQQATARVLRLVPDPAPDPLIRAGGSLGQPVDRLDGPLKVVGAARFAAEFSAPGMAYGALVCATIPRGRVAAIDVAEAASAPGVVLVMTHKNAPRMAPPPQFNKEPSGACFSNLPVMQDAEVHWNGQPVAVVLADSQDEADHAACLVRVYYEEGKADTSFDRMRPTAEPPDEIMGEKSVIEKGDADAALGQAAHAVDQVYRTPFQYHNPIEPHASMAYWKADGGLVVQDSLQMLSLAQGALAKVFGLESEDVRVFSPFVGGGFGSKNLWTHTILAAAAAKLAARPVRIALSREDMFRITGGRTLSEQRVALGAKEDGTLTALIHSGTTAMTPHNDFPEQLTFPARHMYAADAYRIAQEVVLLDMVANTSMRAPGESIGTFALESAVDELAHEMRLDPIELRRRMEPEVDPVSGLAFSSRNLLKAFETGAERFGWSSRSPEPRARREGEWWVGQGVAAATYPYYRMAGATARVRLLADGSAVVQAAAHEMGMGTATVQAQHAADRLGLPLGRVTFEYGDSALPTSTVAGGSSQTASVVAAVTAAVEALIPEVLKLVGNDSPLAGLRASEVEAHDGGLRSKEEPERHEAFAAILARSGRDDVEAEAGAPAPLEVMKYSMHSFGAQFCEVRVSEVTGEVRVSRFVGCFDVGRVLNPKTVASQFRGGIVMGLGLALTEEAFFDARNGRFANPSLAEYHVPVHLDVPFIDVLWTGIPDPHAPLGLRGVGEIGITGVGAAVANAIFNATGARVRDLPITLDKVLAAG